MNAELTNTRKRTRLDRKFDRLRDAEEAGKLGKRQDQPCGAQMHGEPAGRHWTGCFRHYPDLLLAGAAYFSL